MQLDRVLVPLHGSLLAERALPTASALLRERPAATLVLMRATQAPMGGPWTDAIEAQAEAVEEARSYRTHGRSGLRRVVHGSVAESVLRATSTRVLLVPSDAIEFPGASVAPIDGVTVRV